MELFSGNCTVCYKRAIYYNYNCSACEPCKMYYRRSITKYCRYTYERNRKCYDGPPPLSYKDLNCKACRFYKCQKIGMHVNYETVPMCFAHIRKKQNAYEESSQ
ncbi:hypothetical protein GCK72_023074 [Caenorhabditis remanei]|uniref:Nuclear receptor domain-containing protein n=1 Tax=Caenorhabditis remanei TaxID=31234 RepID=A0A6A5FVM8_CAERE|nr:hypothetical protein GCK72_023074 [Caenorhabditis remanei]KAF1746617.1 hypothetical protein GCK72_023074 [Caenorhabditis remanei]